MNASTISPLYQELADALRRRLGVIGDRAAYERNAPAHLQQLQEVSEHIVSLQHRLPTPVDPQLDHYLTKCSYDKALAWLNEALATE